MASIYGASKACRECFDLTSSDKKISIDPQIGLNALLARNAATSKAIRELEEEYRHDETDIIINHERIEEDNFPDLLLEALKICANCDYKSPNVAKYLEKYL